METKEFKIQVPTGYEIDTENSTFECIKFKPIKKLIYDDIARKLFIDKEYYVYDNSLLNIKRDIAPINRPLNCTSKNQAEKLLAINKLMNVAKYLNGDWKPDWKHDDNKYYIKIDYCNYIIPDYTMNFNKSFIYFKSRDLVYQAIEILGEDTIRLALSTDW